MRQFKRSLISITISAAIFFIVAALPMHVWSQEADTDKQPAAEEPQMVLLESQYHFGKIVEGNPILHDFIVQNKGPGVLKIHRVKTT